MLIVSWNVAGLSKTVQRIHETTILPNAASKKNKGNASLDEFFRRHGADIVCLQEHKIPASQLKNRNEPNQCSTLENFESFWACSSSASAMNFGVVTYCRRGTVVRANAAPLGSPDLDAQGRCIMTDHGSFVLFNVYVPASGGLPLSFKMKFLRALQRAMERQRIERKVPVILAGDLNIALDSRDIYWKDRVVYIEEILNATDEPASPLPQWKRDIRSHWTTITSTLETKHVVPTKTTNTHTGEQFEKYRLAVMVGDRRVFLGRHESTRECCLHGYEFGEAMYFDEELQEYIVAQEANAIRLHVLSELMSRIVAVEWSEETLREIADKDAIIHKLSPPRIWLRKLLQDGSMVDSFRLLYPTAEGRFTCWHQFTNRRYVNDGARIDAIIIDRDLVPLVQKGNVESLRCGPKTQAEDPLSELAALAAATANGQFQPVSFEGGGIQEVTPEAIDSQYGAPHTGIIYVPPAFSDHIAISLLLDDALLPRDLRVDTRDLSTRKAQPHMLQRSIADCFAAAATASTSSSSLSSEQARPTVRALAASKQGMTKKVTRRAPISKPTKKPGTNTILHLFRKLEKK